MHEFRRFIQQQLDARGWKQADLARRSGLSRSHISKLLRDSRSHLGQMPDSETITGLAQGFGLSEDVVRTAASRALAGYSDDGGPLQVDLAEISTDALLTEVRRRIEANFSAEGTLSATVRVIRGEGDEHEDTGTQGTPSGTTPNGKAGTRGTPMTSDPTQDNDVALITDNQHSGVDDVDEVDELEGLRQDEFDLARRTVKGGSNEKKRRRTEVQPEDQSQGDGPEFGA